MKVLHTSDWHIGHELYGHDREADHCHFFDQLCGIVKAERPDAMVVCGDIYHTAAPSNTSMALFDRALTAIHRACPTMTIIVAAGNHDSPTRIEVSKSVWAELGAVMTGTIRRAPSGEVDFDRLITTINGSDRHPCGLIAAVPHIYAGAYPVDRGMAVDRADRRQHFFAGLDRAIDRRLQAEGPELPVVLCAHMAVTGCDDSAHTDRGGIEYTGLDDIGVKFDYLALGHIHCRQTFSLGNARARYCGTPLGISFDERFAHAVTIAELGVRGQRPQLREIDVGQFRELVTLPAEGAAPDFDTALGLLAAYDGPDAYLRVAVQRPDAVPPHALERAAEAAARSRGHFCTINWIDSSTNPAASYDAPAAIGSLEQFRALSPADVARQYYLARTGTEMPDELLRLFDDVVNEIMRDDTTATCN